MGCETDSEQTENDSHHYLMRAASLRVVQCGDDSCVELNI